MASLRPELNASSAEQGLNILAGFFVVAFVALFGVGLYTLTGDEFNNVVLLAYFWSAAIGALGVGAAFAGLAEILKRLRRTEERMLQEAYDRAHAQPTPPTGRR